MTTVNYNIDISKLKEEVKEFFTKNGIGKDEQTKITLFLQGGNFSNSIMFPKYELTPIGCFPRDWMVYKFFQQQFFKNIELFLLLGKFTDWTKNLNVYVESIKRLTLYAHNLNLQRYIFSLGFKIDAEMYEYLAFSHAVMSTIKLSPMLENTPETSYTRIIKEIEEEYGRNIQLQIRLLKNSLVDLNTEQKEKIIEHQRQKVEYVFNDFLAFLIKRT